jgi:2-keto-4-pentenoate hydratase/2-oxohepta-3-ene-1,7-dioic acid hydratase in catechol pathway
MKLLRVGAPGAEKPCLLGPDAQYRDLSGAVRDFDAEALSPAGLMRLAALDPASLPVVPPGRIGPCVPRPVNFVCIGLNYADHAAEAHLEVPEHLVVFTKFASCLTGPDVAVALSGDRVDWEAELVVVIGRGGRDIAAADAWDHVAGLAVGQDLSDRTVQSYGRPAQFSMGKSFAGFGPVGPAVTTLDALGGAAADALAIRCEVTDPDGTVRVLQDGTSADMLFGVPEIIHRLTAVVELRPGDVVFTGTPAGVGLGREPQEFLRAGQVLTTTIEGLGSIRQRLL